tara:strand:- start:3680 stop:4675 length:996 start_codon:yes stop_codon:yes gene_type:complete
MATNKHAQIRYNILDNCLSNFQRRFTYADLLEEVNKVLFEMGTEGIQVRQLKYDISFMQEFFGVKINENLKDGKKKVLRYASKEFSIADHPLNQNDSEQLQTTIAILSRYRRREGFDWIEEIIPRMEAAFELVANAHNSAISYQENKYLKGREHLGALFNLIIKNKVTELEYKPYKKEAITVLVHPYHLKQYNNRWFLFCYNEKFKAISNYPLDRINRIEDKGRSFEIPDINWEDYFEDIIGVTRPDDDELQKIKLKFSEGRIKYVTTKAIHESQKLDREDTSGLTVEIEVIPNQELYQTILSFGEDVEVVSPAIVREVVAEKVKKMNQIY